MILFFDISDGDIRAFKYIVLPIFIVCAWLLVEGILWLFSFIEISVSL